MNQREFTRVRSSVPIDCRFAGGRVFAGTTSDVSLNGCFVSCPDPPPDDTTCSAILHIGGRGGSILVTARGVVIRSRNEGFALHFNELEELESYEHLRNLIRYNATDPDQADYEFESHLGLKRIDPSAPPPG